MPKHKFSAVGSYAGIGAMLIPFRLMKGWRVLGNMENRNIHTYRGPDGKNTFEEYFAAPIWETIPEDIVEPTLLAAQPKCGGFSRLFGTSKKEGDTMKKPEDYGGMIYESIEDIARVRPHVFYLENLPKSLLVVPAKDWCKMLPDYHIQFEWVSNYHYGNPQKPRNRLYVIGSRNGFRFTPQETKIGCNVRDRISDLNEHWGCLPNHDKHSRKDEDGLTNLAKSNKWKDIAKYVLANVPQGKNIDYMAKDGNIKQRIGSNMMYWDKHSHTLAGVKGAKFHPLHGFPLSIRERCRLQGYPDDFIIQGTKFEEDGTWSLRKNSMVVRQLNNTMPLEFCTEFGDQLDHYMRHGDLLRGEEPIRALKPNPLIDDANRVAEKFRTKRAKKKGKKGKKK